MLPKATSKDEQNIQREYYRKIIKQSWDIIDIEQKQIVDEKEFSYLMRHLHQFPDEAHVQDLIEEEVRGDDLAGLSLSRQISFD